MHRVATCLLIILVSWPLSPHADEGTYCDDPAVWADWHARALKNAGDLDFQTLHALWLGLCAKVSTGTVTADEAIALFEHARATLIQRLREERQQKPGPPAL